MRIPIVITAVAITVLTAACSSTSPTAATKQTARTTSPAPSNPDAGLLTGTQLKARLAPASWFPPGFTLQPHSSVNTGSYYQPPLSPGRLTCRRLDSTSWVPLAGGGAVSFAQDAYLDTNLGEYAQEVNVYQGTTAQRVMANLRQVVTVRCRHFNDPQTSSTVTVELRKGPHLGDDALTIRLHDPRWTGDATLEAVRLGTVVATVYYSALSGTGQAQATKLAALISANLKKPADARSVSWPGGHGTDPVAALHSRGHG